MPTRLTDLTDPDDLRAVAAFLLGMVFSTLLSNPATRHLTIDEQEAWVLRRALRSRTLGKCGDAT